MPLTASQLGKLYPHAPRGYLQAFVDRHAALFARFGIAGGRNRLHFFLAQIGHESGGLRVTEENLDYTAPRLMAVWPRRFPTLAAASAYAHRPQKLANHVYANRMGNGDAASNDGWRFRGRGYAQVTGRDGYEAVGRHAGVDLVGHPERAAAPEYALQVACAFWQWKKLDRHADAGDFIACTRAWNGGTTNMDDRWAWLARVQRTVPWSTMAPEREAGRMSAAVVMHVQRVLRAAGLYAGSIDGVIGRLTRAGLRAWQADHGLAVVGEITRETLDSMPAAAKGLSSPAPTVAVRRGDGVHRVTGSESGRRPQR